MLIDIRTQTEDSEDTDWLDLHYPTHQCPLLPPVF